MPSPGAPPAAKKSNAGLIILIVGIVIGLPCIAMVAAGIFGAKLFSENIMPMAGCAMDLEFMNKALHNYAKKHDGKLPKAATWQTDLRPFVKTAMEDPDGDQDYGPFQPMDPDDTLWGCGKGEKKTGYAFNDDVSEKILKDISADSPNKAVIFEVKKPQENLHQPWVKPDHATAPRFTGWMWVSADGEVHMSLESSSRRRRSRTSTED